MKIRKIDKEDVQSAIALFTLLIIFVGLVILFWLSPWGGFIGTGCVVVFFILLYVDEWFAFLWNRYIAKQEEGED